MQFRLQAIPLTKGLEEHVEKQDNLSLYQYVLEESSSHRIVNGACSIVAF